MLFNYKARTIQGEIISGTITAPGVKEGINLLHQQNYIVMELKEAPVVKPSPLSLQLFKKKIKEKDIVVFSRQLSVLINAGVPIIQGLEVLIQQMENPTFKEVLTQIRNDIEQGTSLSEALSKHPKVFSNLYVGMVKAGEVGGVLDVILERLSDYLESQSKLKGKMKSSLTYPIVIGVMAIVMCSFMMISIIPTFKDIFTGFGKELPAITKGLISFSEWFGNNILYILGIIIAIFFGIRFWKKTESGNLYLSKLNLKLPIIGNLVRKLSISRFSLTLGTLIKSGVPILQAMDIVAKTVGNKVIEDVIIKAKENIREGEKISAPLAEGEIFPPMVIRMIAVGEETGNLETMLSKVSEFYESEVDATLQSVTSVLEPIIMVFMGLIIGFIVIAIFLPIFEMGVLPG